MGPGRTAVPAALYASACEVRLDLVAVGVQRLPGLASGALRYSSIADCGLALGPGHRLRIGLQGLDAASQASAACIHCLGCMSNFSRKLSAAFPFQDPASSLRIPWPTRSKAV